MRDFRDVFGPDGLLARQVPGYALRHEQLVMAEAVARALEHLDILVVEAGTGTGKTFAYLVPALLSGRRVIISTGTRNLQDQLFKRDLPTVSSALGVPASVALLKGRANYLCRHRLALVAERSRPPGPAAQQFAHIQAWARLTGTGDVAEVDIPEEAPIWPQVTSTAENCLGQDCPEYARCHVVQARRAALEADIVVVNHHLLLADFALKEDGFGELLPDSDAVIVDEAHQIPEVAAQLFGITLTQGQLQGLARDTLAEGFRAGAGANLREATDALLQVARTARLALGVEPRRASWGELQGDALSRLEDVRGAIAALSQALEPLGGLSPGLDSCRRRALALGERLAALLDEDHVPWDGLRWLETFLHSFALHMTPLEAAESLNRAVQARAGAWVFTSATLAVGDDFTHFMQRVGLEEGSQLRLESPFDYADNALLYLPEGLPLPSHPGYTERVVELALPLLDASGGRAFLLFTSHRALRKAHEQFTAAGLPYPLLVQGTAPRDELLRRFRRLGNAVLLGTGSFWEGVDVRGPALSLVVIDKLPFAAPGDPLMQARLEAIRDRGGNPFRDYQLPQAVISLKQGVGRLIRDIHDRGVLTLCDPRLRSRSYGSVFLRSLPPMRRSADPDEVMRFLRDLAPMQALPS